MSYEALLRKSWTSGDFKVSETEAAEADAADTASILKVRREMEEIAARETWDANSCLVAHREGIMKLAPFVKFREEKFGAVLFETRSEKVYTLSPTGAAVVREVIAGAESASLVSKLKEKFEDPTGKMAQEAESFLAQLKEKGLIVE
ncbi:MAG: PqqD family protein [Elusimicrobiota bacterium]|nr:MAG: PqqD family protein [Elusimicrobiota bacterium]